MTPQQWTGWSGLGSAAPVGLAPSTTFTQRPAGAAPLRVPPLTGESRAAIAKLVRQITMNFLIDCSGSMSGPWGDPTDVTGAAAESVINLQRASGGGHAGVVLWGSDAPRDLAVGPLDVTRDAKALRAALRNNASLGGTNIAAGIARGKELADAAPAGDTVITVVLTDGMETVDDAVRAAVASLAPSSMHICLIDRSNGCSPAMEAAWRSLPLGSFTRLQSFDLVDITSQIVTIFANTLHLTAPAITAPQKK